MQLLLFTRSPVHWYAAVREQLVCPYSGNDMPPAKVFHQNACWLKARGEADFFDCWKCLRHNFFWSIAPSYFYVDDNCHRIYFFPASLISTPQKHDIFGDGATVFYKLANPPIDVSVPTPILHPYVDAAFIYSFHPPTLTHAHTQVHVHSSVLDTDVHMESSCLLTPASTERFLIKPLPFLL